MIATNTASARLSRLLRLMIALQVDGYPNARELATLCQVSRRTIYRDLDALEAAGIAVNYHPGRQGYRLASALAPTARLQEREALALLMGAHAMAGPGAEGFDHDARDGIRKIIQAMPAESRARLTAVSEALPAGDAPGAVRPERRAVFEALLQALADRRQVRIWYREAADASVETTRLSPFRLALTGLGWRLVGRSSGHGAVRAFLVSGIENAVLTDDPYIVPPRFPRAAEAPAQGRDAGERIEVRIRCSPRQAAALGDLAAPGTREIEPRSDGRVEVSMTLDGPDEALSLLIRLGDDAEVVSPRGLRDRVRETARRIALRHDPDRPDAVPVAEVA